VDGVIYLITAQLQVFALDGATGRVIWHYKYPKPQALPPNTHADRFIFNRGVAVGDGKVFFGTRDAYLVALDQKTGREVWKVAVDDPKQCGCNITGAPLIVKDKVIVGGTGGDQAHRGYLTAFYTMTGRLAWRWYVIPGPGEKGNETWKGDSWKFGGGSPWLTGSYDADLNLVYWGTGNAASDLYDGDRVPVGFNKVNDVNLYTASVVALDAATGKLRWHHQEVPDDVWDYDSSYEVILMDREIRGRMRKVLVHLNKGGLTTVLDRATGEFLGVFSVPEVRNWITGVTEDGRLVSGAKLRIRRKIRCSEGLFDKVLSDSRWFIRVHAAVPWPPPESGQGRRLPVWRVRARADSWRIWCTSRSSARLFWIHSRYSSSAAGFNSTEIVRPFTLRVQ